jgi:uncharacterized protein DUF6599
MSLPKRFAFLLACFIAAPLFGQNVQNAQSSANILPDGFAGWKATSRQPFSPGLQPILNKAGYDQSQNAQAAAREYGFVTGETVVYSPGVPGSAGNIAPQTLTATVYRMKDPSGAYGEYSYLRTQDMNRADFTEHSSSKPDEALVLAGNLVLDVQGPNSQRNAADVKVLVTAVASKAFDGLFPTLPDRLPSDDRIDKTDHYILGPQTLDQFFPGQIGSSLGFTYSPEVETAHFRMGKNDVTLLIADFPTPQIAQGQLDSLSKKYDVNGSLPAAGTPALFAERNQTLLSVVAGAPSAEEANKLLDKVQSGTVLTWNEPTFQFNEPSIEVMVVGAFVGTGVICLITLVGALAFTGFRLTIKKMFPNTVFDRSTQMEVLQMGLVSKPIKSEDFYTFDGKRIDTGTVDKSLPDRTALRLFK